VYFILCSILLYIIIHVNSIAGLCRVKNTSEKEREWRGSRGNGAKGGSDDAKRAARWVSVEGDLRERHVGRDSG